MNKESEKANSFLSAGIALFLCGATLAATLDHWILRAIGIALLVLASALFGASIRLKNPGK